MAGVPIFAVLLLAAVTAGAAAQCSTGAEWELILSQAATAGVFPEPADVLDVDFNANEPGSLLFSNLSGLETRRSDDGLFYFRLQWPELCDNAEVFPCVNGSTAVVWAQSSNPLVTNTVTGYQSIDVSYDGAGFVGLVRGNYAHLDGADGFGFWYSVGSYELFNGLLPGPVSAGQTQGHATQRVELWVKRVQSPAVFDAGSGTACAEYATCAVVNGNASCVCPAGFTGNGEDACTDIDECALGTDTCSPNADCVNTAGGFSCFCREGFFGSGQTCEVDECASEATNDCDANAVCTKILGSFFCNCTEGYIGNGRSCVNVDECAGTPCHANATCTDVEGAFACRCNEGFDGDGTTSCERDLVVWLEADDYNNTALWLDKSGNNNHANISGVAFNDRGNRFIVNMTDESATLEDLIRVNLDIGPTAFPNITVELFFQPVSTVGSGAVLDSDNGGYDRSLLADDESYGGFGAGTGSPFFSGVNAPFLRCWHHAFAVFQQDVTLGSFVRVDGIVGEPTTAVNGQGYPYFTVGGSFFGDGSWNGGMFGFVRRIKVYKRALTAAELERKYRGSRDELICECLHGFRGVEETGCLDIDECAEDTHDCNRLPGRAFCTNTFGSFNCTCEAGYIGDGYVCDAPQDCVLSEWTDAGNCSASCGYGTVTQERTVLRNATGNGLACPAGSRSRTASCFAGACPASATFDFVVDATAGSLVPASSDPLRLPSVGTTVGGAVTETYLVLLTEQAAPTTGLVRLEYAVEVPTGEATAVEAAVDTLVASSSGTVTKVHFAERPACYCAGETALGLPWIGAACGALSSSSGLVGCPTNTTIIGTTGASRRCRKLPDNTGEWQDVDTGNCALETQPSAAALNQSNVQTVVNALLLASDGVLAERQGSTDVAVGADLLDKVFAQYLAGSRTLNVEDIVAVMRLLSRLIEAPSPAAAAGLRLRATSGVRAVSRIEQVLFAFAERSMVPGQRVSVVETTAAFDLVRLFENATLEAAWPPARGVAAAENVFCYLDRFDTEQCSVLHDSPYPTRFDGSVRVTVPALALSAAPALGSDPNGTATVLLGAYARSFLFPATTQLVPVSQVPFATVANLPATFNLTADPLLFEAAASDLTAPKCAAWTPGAWSDVGCGPAPNASVDNGVVACACTHMTHFGIVTEIEPEPSLTSPSASALATTGQAIAGLILMVVVAIYLFKPSHWTPSRFIILNMALTVLVFIVLMAVSAEQTESDSCRDFGAAMHFFIVAAFFWSLAAALLLVTGRTPSLLALTAFGYLPALITVIVTVALRHADYGRYRSIDDAGKNCFVDYTSDLIYAGIGPIAAAGGSAVVIFNGLLFRTLCCWPTSGVYQSAQGERTRSLALRLAMVHMVLVGQLGAIAVSAVAVANAVNDSFWDPIFTFATIIYALVLLIFFALRDLYLMCKHEGGDWDANKTTAGDESLGSAKPTLARSDRNTLRLFASMPRAKVADSFEMVTRPGTGITSGATSRGSSKHSNGLGALADSTALGAGKRQSSMKRERTVDLYAGVPTMLRRRGSLDLRDDEDVPFNFMPDPIAMERENFASKPVVAAKLIREFQNYDTEMAAFDEMNMDDSDFSDMEGMDEPAEMLGETGFSASNRQSRRSRRKSPSVYGAPVRGLPAGLMHSGSRPSTAGSVTGSTTTDFDESSNPTSPLTGALATSVLSGRTPPTSPPGAWQDSSAAAMDEEEENENAAAAAAAAARGEEGAGARDLHMMPPPSEAHVTTDDFYAEPAVGEDGGSDEFAEVAAALRAGAAAGAK